MANLIVLLILAVSPVHPVDDESESQASHWNQFRGQGGRGAALDGADYPAKLDPETNMLWATELPAGHSSPVVSGEKVFVTGHREGALAVLCLDRTSGAVLWQSEVEGGRQARIHRVNNLVSSTPTTDGERVYSYFSSFGLVAHNVADGSVAWSRSLATPKNTFGAAASPILAHGRLLIVHDANDGSYLESIEPATGEVLWHRERTAFKSGWSTPVVWENAGRREILVYGIWWLTAYEFESGEELWSVPGLADEPIVMPAIGEGLVYVTSYNMGSNLEVEGLPEFASLVADLDSDGDGMLDAAEAAENKSVLSRTDADGEGDHPLGIFFRFLDEDKDGKLTESEWPKLSRWLSDFAQINGLVAIRPGDAESKLASIAWQYPHGTPECPSPLYLDGRIYLVKNGGLLTCLDAVSGEPKYQERLDARGPFYSSPVTGGGNIYAASARGVVTVLAPGDELRILSRTDLGERIMATPALSAGVVFVRTESYLRAFGPGQ